MTKKLLAVMLLMLCLGLCISANADELYNVWIGGNQLHEGFTSGAGWSYDPATNTLTLNGANIQGIFPENYAAHAGAGIYHGDADDETTFTIKLVGTNKVTGYSAASIYPTGIKTGFDVDLVISGTGSLEASAVAPADLSIGNGCYAIYVSYGDLTVTESASVTAKATSNDLVVYAAGMWVESGTVTIDEDATVKAYLNHNGSKAIGGTADVGAAIYAKHVVIDYSSVEAYTGNCMDTSSGINVLINGSVTINSGNVTAKGSTGEISCGIYAGIGGLFIGENAGTVTATGSAVVNGQSYGLSSEGGITIKGGNVIATGGNVTGSGVSCGIHAECTDYYGDVVNEVLISGGSVTATGGATNSEYGSSSYGIEATGWLAIRGGSVVTATGGNATAINGSAQSFGLAGMSAINIGSSTVKATAGSGDVSYGMVSDSTITLSQYGSTTVEAIGNSRAIFTYDSFGGTVSGSMFTLNKAASATAAGAVTAYSFNFPENYSNYRYFKMEPERTDVPVTGDNAPVGLLLAMCLTSFSALIAVTYVGKKRKAE